MKRLRYLGLALLTALLLWSGPSLNGLWISQARFAPDSEIRGVWLTNVDSQVFFSTTAVETAIQTLADHHFNTIYPAIWSWGYTLYPSQIGAAATGFSQGLYPDLEDEGRNTVLEAAQGDRDPFQEIITFAHTQNLRVIPWFEFGFMAPANSPLAQRHPNWLTQKQGPLPAAQLHLEGRHPRVWLNPFHPEVQQFILDLVDEIAANYPIDGLQLDDHFALPIEFGYDPYTISLYRQEHQGQAPPSDPNDPTWMQWRADKITQFLGRVFRTVKAQRPDAILSISPNPADFAYQHSLQDWPRWREIGYVEELMVQVYRHDVSSFQQTLRDRTIQQARQHIPTGVGILSGLKDQPVPMTRIQQQVQAAREMNFAGVSFFFYDTLWNLAPAETMSDRTAALRQLFAQSAPPTQLRSLDRDP